MNYTLLFILLMTPDLHANGLSLGECKPHVVSSTYLSSIISQLDDSKYVDRVYGYALCDSFCNGRRELPSPNTMTEVFKVVQGSASPAAIVGALRMLSSDCGARGISTEDQRKTLTALRNSKIRDISDFATIASLRYGPEDLNALKSIVSRGVGPQASAALEIIDDHRKLDKQIISEALNSSNPNLRIMAASRLSNRHMLPEWFDKLMADSDSRVRMLAIRNAREPNLISRGLTDVDPGIRNIAERRLGNRKPKKND